MAAFKACASPLTGRSIRRRNCGGIAWDRVAGSFAVIGDRLYTQEQRGTKESVVCYSVNKGDEVWVHDDEARFTEVVGGPGPRATPTYHEGKIYAYGATGKLNCLDAATGKEIWHDVVADSAPWCRSGGSPRRRWSLMVW